MSWPKNYVLVPERRPGGEVRKLANSMAEHYGVPTQNLFSGSNDEATAFDNFRVATEDCCKASDMSTKLIVCGHGGPDRACGYNEKSMASWLQWVGVSAAGLIAFKCCMVGKKDFLDVLLNDLIAYKIQVGYLIGYKEPTWLQPKGKLKGFFGAARVPVKIVEGNAHAAVPNASLAT